MARTCPSCGRSVEVTLRGLCPECFARTYGVARLPARVEARICRYCGRLWLGGRWRRVHSFAEAVEAVVRYEASRARPVSPLTGLEVAEVGFSTRPNWATRAYAVLHAAYEGVEVRDSVEMVVLLRPSICPLCKTRVSGEYDTLLNILNAPEGLEDEVVEEAWRLGLEGQLVDIIRSKEGLGVYLTNRGAASKILKALSRRYLVERLGEAHEDVGIDSRGRRRTRRIINVRIQGGKD